MKFLPWLFTLFSQAVLAQTVSTVILIDQFGYLPDATKTAVIKNPKTGFDSAKPFTPGTVYQVIDKQTGQPVYESAPVLFNNGITDAASGDQLWWFDFTPLSARGEYYILDKEKNIQSYPFRIGNDVYEKVLEQAVRMFFYQRAGCEKQAQYAGAEWADGASHTGTRQDKNCRLYNKKDDPTTERDLHGGWFDAGDYNKYTNWACSYIESLLLSYFENPDIWTDETNIPESGNGLPDVLDEVKWGMDWLLRMQEQDGSVLSVMGLSHASPPSAANGQSLYGPATTMSAFSAVKAYSLGYKAYNQIGLTDYAEKLKTAALKAWEWAEQHPNVLFHNNSNTNGSSGLGAGDQEVTGDHNRAAIRLAAALYLYEVTADRRYLNIFETGYTVLPLFAWSNDMQQYWSSDHFLCLYYLSLAGISEIIKNRIINAFTIAANKTGNYAGQIGKDGYRSFIKDYNWGSNQYKSNYGLTFYLFADKSVEPAKNSLYSEAALDYLHYIHGVNPLGLVYLTNMNRYGASNSLTEIYHTWFDHHSAQWNKVTETTPGPAPGYLAGGPNENYQWDGCCPNGCGSTVNNAICRSEEIPVNQPPAKMYKDFNTSWPLNSWQITEPMGAYQVAYIRLLSKFISKNGNNANTPITIHPEATPPSIYPIPAKETVQIQLDNELIRKVEIFDIQSRSLLNQPTDSNHVVIHTGALSSGFYFVQITTDTHRFMSKLIIINK